MYKQLLRIPPQLSKWMPVKVLLKKPLIKCLIVKKISGGKIMLYIKIILNLAP